MLIERNLSVHPEVRTLARLEAARIGTHMRFAVGCALDRLASQKRVPTKPARLLNRDRVSLVASANQETWNRLDAVRDSHGITWNSLVDIALGGGAQ